MSSNTRMSSRTRALANGRVVVAIALLAAMFFVPGEGQATPDDDHTGDVLQTLNLLGTAADCSAFTPGIGTSLAIVQGSKVATGIGDATFTQYPLLLVTSCLASGGSASAKAKKTNLYFTDPGSPSNPSSATVVKTLATTKAGSAFAPGNGWAKFVLAPDRGILYGCGDNGELYSIDYIANSIQEPDVTDGSVLLVMPKPAAITSCSGLAWDPDGNILYQGAGSTIYYFNPSAIPSPLPSFAAPTGCTVSGLSVVGGVLLVACNNTTVYRRNRLSSPTPGAALTDKPLMTFNKPGTLSPLSDLECDPISFSGVGFSTTRRNTDAIWSKIPATNKIQAFWVPPGTCSLPTTETVFAPAACPDSPPTGSVYSPSAIPPGPGYRNADGSPIDSDGDGLWNCWKDPKRWTDNIPGIGFVGGASGDPAQRDVMLCANGNTECATPGIKEIFVEIDYMGRTNGVIDATISHQPDALALLDVQNAFAAAPVDPINPTGFKGITLHFQVDEAIEHNSLLALEPCTPAATAANGAADFDAIKQSSFGTLAERTSGKPHAISAKRFAFRYMVFGHNLVGSASSAVGSGSSGCSEVPGDDSVITLGSFTVNALGHNVGARQEQAGTVMHELGHNLGLRHGGGDNINCKPNYLSLMSYGRQFPDYISNRPLDYSRDLLATLTEGSLKESDGIGTPHCGPDNAPCALWNTVYSSPTAFTTPPPLPVTLSAAAPGIDWNTNHTVETVTLGTTVDINQLGADVGCDGSGASLVGFDDWAKLQYNARASLEFAGARTPSEVHNPTRPDKKAEEEDASFKAADLDGDGVADAMNCGSAGPCVIDIKPGTNPRVISKNSGSNIQVAIRASATFDPSIEVCRDTTLTLNNTPVKVNANGVGTCSTSLNANGRQDLICQFPMSALPLGLSKSVLQGKKVPFGETCPLPPNTSSNKSSFRARDAITVQ